MKFNFGKFKVFVPVVLIALNAFVIDTAAFVRKTEISDSKIIISGKAADDFDADDFQIFTLINAERAKNGLNQLLWNDEAAKIALDYSKRMANENFFSHLDSNGQSVVDRAKSAKLKHWSKIGENLFAVEGLDDFDDFVVKNWMESPTHRENILDRDWMTTGIGIAESKDGEIFITQIFLKR